MTTPLNLTGLIAGVLVVSYIVWGIWSHRKKSGGSQKPFSYLFPGFGVLTVTRVHTDTQGLEHEVTQDTADIRAYQLRDAYTRTWNKCVNIYGWGRGTWPIESVVVVDGIVHEKHPHVMWNAPLPRVWLRLQDGMAAWFAKEVHNVFRYHLHGMNHIYKTVDDVDLMRAQETAAWIEGEFGGR